MLWHFYSFFPPLGRLGKSRRGKPGLLPFWGPAVFVLFRFQEGILISWNNIMLGSLRSWKLQTDIIFCQWWLDLEETIQNISGGLSLLGQTLCHLYHWKMIVSLSLQETVLFQSMSCLTGFPIKAWMGVRMPSEHGSNVLLIDLATSDKLFLEKWRHHLFQNQLNKWECYNILVWRVIDSSFSPLFILRAF